MRDQSVDGEASGQSDSAERIKVHAQALRRDARAAWHEAGLLRQAMNEAARARVDLPAWTERVRRHPMRSMLLAAGAGYVLGGGLVAPVTGRVLATALRLGWRVGLRGWALPLLRDVALRRVTSV